MPASERLPNSLTLQNTWHGHDLISFFLGGWGDSTHSTFRCHFTVNWHFAVILMIQPLLNKNHSCCYAVGRLFSLCPSAPHTTPAYVEQMVICGSYDMCVCVCVCENASSVQSNITQVGLSTKSGTVYLLETAFPWKKGAPFGVGADICWLGSRS